MSQFSTHLFEDYSDANTIRSKIVRMQTLYIRRLLLSKYLQLKGVKQLVVKKTVDFTSDTSEIVQVLQLIKNKLFKYKFFRQKL